VHRHYNHFQCDLINYIRPQDKNYTRLRHEFLNLPCHRTPCVGQGLCSLLDRRRLTLGWISLNCSVGAERGLFAQDNIQSAPGSPQTTPVTQRACVRQPHDNGKKTEDPQRREPAATTAQRPNATIPNAIDNDRNVSMLVPAGVRFPSLRASKFATTRLRNRSYASIARATARFSRVSYRTDRGRAIVLNYAARLPEHLRSSVELRRDSVTKSWHVWCNHNFAGGLVSWSLSNEFF
jgi:hypothetical protein